MSLFKKLGLMKTTPVEIQVSGEVYSIVFSPDARHILSGGHSKTIGHWRVEDGRGVGEAMEVTRYLLNVAVSRDGRLVACGGSDGTAEVWDVQTHKKVVEVGNVGARVFCVDVSSDSTRFATGADRNAAVWSVSSGRLLVGPLRHPDAVAAVKFSPSGDRIATASWEQHSIRLYDSSGDLLFDIPDRVSSPYNTSLVWSNDGKQLFTASHAGKIKCFHVSGSFLSWTEWDVQVNNQPVSIALAANGKFIVSASSRFVSFWDTVTHARIGPVLKQSERIWAVALSSDAHLASGGDDKKITLRNLKNILPRPYLASPSDVPSVDLHEGGPLLEIRRLETLLDERYQAIQEAQREKDALEQNIQSLSATVRDHEENSAQLKQEIPKLKATAHGLRKQLSESQGTVHKLTKRLDETSEAAGQHKLEADRIKAAFNELKVKHEAELAQAQKHPLPIPDPQAQTRGTRTGIDAFESWMRDHSDTATTTLSEGLDDHSRADYNALACCAFVEARAQNWNAAYEIAQQSLSTRPSAIGHIAKAVALVGQRDYKGAMRAFSLVFRDGDPRENEFMLVIWSILSCLSGEYIDGILRIHDLVSTADADKAVRGYIQAYMYILLGNRYMREADYDRAIQLFEQAKPLSTGVLNGNSRLGLISLISGWQFDELEMTARHGLRDALQAAGRTRDVSEPLVEENR